MGWRYWHITIDTVCCIIILLCRKIQYDSEDSWSINDKETHNKYHTTYNEYHIPGNDDYLATISLLTPITSNMLLSFLPKTKNTTKICTVLIIKHTLLFIEAVKNGCVIQTNPCGTSSTLKEGCKDDPYLKSLTITLL